MAREYYSIPEAAALLGVSRIAAFKRVKKGQLQALRIGRNWAVPASALLPAVAPRTTVPDVVQRKAVKNSQEFPLSTSDSDMDSMGWD